MWTVSGVLTALGLLDTILTASSSLSVSQRPSDANIRNESSGLSFLMVMDGSADITGLFKEIG